MSRRGVSRRHGGVGVAGPGSDEPVAEGGALEGHRSDELIAEALPVVSDELSLPASDASSELPASEVALVRAIGRLLLDAQQEADAIVNSAHQEAARRLAESERRMSEARVRGRWLLSYMRAGVIAGLAEKDGRLPGSSALRGEFFGRLDRASEHLSGYASPSDGGMDLSGPGAGLERVTPAADPMPTPDLSGLVPRPATIEVLDPRPEPRAAVALEPLAAAENETATRIGRQLPTGLANSRQKRRRTRQSWATCGLWGRNVGLFLLLFCLYQVWGTGLQEAHSQGALKDAFDAARAEGKSGQPAPAATEAAPAATEAAPAATEATSLPPVAQTQPGTTLPVRDVQPELPNEAVAILRIPKIGLDKAVVDGTSVEDLRKGPGRYDGSAPPGSPGNFSVAGHRTTYGAPFREIDELVVGDIIEVSTVAGDFTYAVSEPPRVVTPEAGEVLADFGDTRLTLTTCHPEYRASQRLVVVATLVEQEMVEAATGLPATGVTSTAVAGGEADTPNAPVAESQLSGAELVADLGLEGSGSAWLSFGGWSVAACFVVLAVRQHAFKRLGYLLATPVAVFVMLNLFESLNRLLPAGV